ncbi:hypothetical protein Ddc_11211 [Ditylenchus destructor]|nr:hypothetical protein Ddc_11211 [Ditylenchus destructor]
MGKLRLKVCLDTYDLGQTFEPTVQLASELNKCKKLVMNPGCGALDTAFLRELISGNAQHVEIRDYKNYHYYDYKYYQGRRPTTPWADIIAFLFRPTEIPGEQRYLYLNNQHSELPSRDECAKFIDEVVQEFESNNVPLNFHFEFYATEKLYSWWSASRKYNNQTKQYIGVDESAYYIILKTGDTAAS